MHSGFCYGPFMSRRLGLSLGVNVLFNGASSKRCTYSCVYCEIGRTRDNELTGPDHVVDVKPGGFREELAPILSNLPEIDSVTFGYNGEPTLNPNLGAFLDVALEVRDSLGRDRVPKMTVFTNSSTVTRPEVRKTLARFDLVLAKLDVGTQADFLRVDRPHGQVPPIGEIVKGLTSLKSEVEAPHQLALQSLFFSSSNPKVVGNDQPASVAAWASQVERISPYMVQIYTIAREPAEKFVRALSKQKLNEIGTVLRARLGPGSSTEILVF
ncbi:MAG: radical SAM protein [Promethearchaeota archaeon]